MNYTNKLLDMYRKSCSISTDMAAAESLGLGRSAVSGWRHGNRHAEADAVEKMCKATGEPVEKWLHLIEAERARTPAAAKVWLRLAQAAATIAGAFLLLRQGVDAHTMTALIFASPYTLCEIVYCWLSSLSRYKPAPLFLLRPAK